MNYVDYEKIRCRVFQEVTGYKWTEDVPVSIFKNEIEEIMKMPCSYSLDFEQRQTSPEEAETFFRSHYQKIRQKWADIKAGKIKLYGRFLNDD